MTATHVHEWTDWYLPIWYRDCFGHLIGDVGLARLSGTDEPVTDGWARVCRTCDTEQRS